MYTCTLYNLNWRTTSINPDKKKWRTESFQLSIPDHGLRMRDRDLTKSFKNPYEWEWMNTRMDENTWTWEMARMNFRKSAIKMEYGKSYDVVWVLYDWILHDWMNAVVNIFCFQVYDSLNIKINGDDLAEMSSSWILCFTPYLTHSN